jgi:hypothetical protein
MMKNGGNAKLRAFFESYNIPKDSPVDFKFKTKAGFYYREMVEIKSKFLNLSSKPLLKAKTFLLLLLSKKD